MPTGTALAAWLVETVPLHDLPVPIWRREMAEAVTICEIARPAQSSDLSDHHK